VTNCYKLTDKALRTRGGYYWPVGEWREETGIGKLCGPGWLHGYESTEVAVFMIPIHAHIDDPILWEAEAEGEILRDGQLKFGATRMRIIRQIPWPILTAAERAEIAIRCALVLPQPEDFRVWATRWLDGTDRSEKAVRLEAAAAWREWRAKYAREAEDAREAKYARTAVAKAVAAGRSEARAAAASAARAAARVVNLDLIGIINQVIAAHEVP
jgi:hypothetical protein